MEGEVGFTAGLLPGGRDDSDNVPRLPTPTSLQETLGSIQQACHTPTRPVPGVLRRHSLQQKPLEGESKDPQP